MVSILSRRNGATYFDGTNSRLRLGVAPCLEVLVDVPNYFAVLNGDGQLRGYRRDPSNQVADQSRARKDRSIRCCRRWIADWNPEYRWTRR